MSKKGNWLGRVIRGMRPDRNPLRRKSDRIETFVLAGSLAAAIAAAPFAAHLAGEAGYAAARHAERSELSSSHEVKAVLLRSAGGTTTGYSLQSAFPAQVRWTGPGGRIHAGQVMVPVAMRKGATIDIWVDAAGRVITPPLQPAQVAGQADLAATGAIAGLALLYICEAVVVRQLLNRRRLAAWDAEWAVTEPTWNRQRW